MTFGEAIECMRDDEGDGLKVARSGWNGKHMYIYMKTVDDKLVPWLASQTDMLSTDWFVVS